MIHIFVLVLFIQSLFFSLVFYDELKYGIIIGTIFVWFVFFKFIFHIKHRVGFILLFICTTVLMFQYFSYRIEYLNNEYKTGFIFNHKEKVEVKGVIKNFPEYRFSNNQYILTIEDASTKVLLFTEMYQKFRYGEILILKGDLQDIREQDARWHMYYKKIDVHYVLFNPQIIKISEENKTDIFQKLFQFKVFLRTLILDRFSSHASALVLGMLLGEKQELSKKERETFNTVGLSHILVVSGYNISILISFIFVVFKYINKQIKIILALIFISLFVLLVGGEASVVRAALMGSIIIFAKITRRPSSAINVLFLVATSMLISNPFSIFDAGFHLSFIATFSLLILPNIKNIPEVLQTTLWVFLFVSPYILYISEYISIGSIMSNLLVVVLLPIFMFTALVSIVFSAFGIFIGIDIIIVESIARYIFVVSNSIEKIPRLSMNIEPSFLMVLYSLFCVVYIYSKNRYTTLEFIEKHYQKFVPQQSN